MSSFLIGILNKRAQKSREPRSYLTLSAGVVGVVSNTLLAALKLFIGIVSGSVSLMADAVNNLSDMISSVIVIVSAYLASKPGDAEHPYGHGRLEYLAGLVVSVMVGYVGFNFIIRSYERIVYPVKIDVQVPAIIAIFFSIIVKIWQGYFYKKMGENISSGTLTALSADSISDVFTTAVVVFGLIVSKFTTLPVDGMIGIIVALGIMKNAYELIKSTLSPLIGKAVSDDLKRELLELIEDTPEVLGCHDFMVHEYGPLKRIMVADVEFDARKSLVEVHDIIDMLECRIEREYGIHAVLAVDPKICDSEELDDIRKTIYDIVMKHPEVLNVHDIQPLLSGNIRNIISFHIAVNGDIIKSEDDYSDLKCNIIGELNRIYKEYNFVVTIDREFN